MDSRVTEFQCIMPMANIPSVLKLGVLSNERAAKLKHHSVAMPEMQDKRDVKQVPGGLKLHQYANLYFHARNPMMSKRRDEALELCVRNAAGGDNWVRFLHPRQWELLDFDRIYARDWTHPDRFEYFDRKRKKCAEVLVPHCVEPRFITGAYVVDSGAAERLAAAGFTLAITVDSDMFFR